MLTEAEAEKDYERWCARYKAEAAVDGILVDETHALMSKEAFEKLLDYSMSLPSGTYLHKRWRKQSWRWAVDVLDRPYRVWLGQWMMGEYEPCNIPGQVGIHWRRILIV